MPTIPVLIQILAIFALVVFASARKVHLGLAAVAGGILFTLLRGLSIPAILLTLVREAADPDTILLLLLLIAIMAFSGAMKKAGALWAFNEALKALTPSHTAALPIAPLLIGTLPMPGGAVLSAPLVDALDPERSLGAERLSAINYWFRHTLELSWPLYPAFILTSTLADIPTTRLMLLNLYAPICLFTLGTIFVLKRGRIKPALAKVDETALSGKPPSRLAAIAHGFAPLAIVLGSYATLDAIWRLLAPGLDLPARVNALAGRYFPIMAGIGIGSVFISVRGKGKNIFKHWVTASSLKMVAVVLGIRCFSALLEAGSAATAASLELTNLGISPVIVAVVLPFIAGLVTGVGFGYVGLSFPIVLGLFATDGGFPKEAVVVLAGAAGYTGMMLSPLHVCMVVSAEHFGTKAATTIKRIALPLLLFFTVAVAYVTLLRRFL